MFPGGSGCVYEGLAWVFDMVQHNAGDVGQRVITNSCKPILERIIVEAL